MLVGFPGSRVVDVFGFLNRINVLLVCQAEEDDPYTVAQALLDEGSLDERLCKATHPDHEEIAVESVGRAETRWVARAAGYRTGMVLAGSRMSVVFRRQWG